MTCIYICVCVYTVHREDRIPLTTLSPAPSSHSCKLNGVSYSLALFSPLAAAPGCISQKILIHSAAFKGICIWWWRLLLLRKVAWPPGRYNIASECPKSWFFFFYQLCYFSDLRVSFSFHVKGMNWLQIPKFILCRERTLISELTSLELGRMAGRRMN